MLSLARCRQILGRSCQLNDQELETVRDQLYALADIAVDTGRQSHWLRDPAVDVGADGHALRHLPDEIRESVIERAAIMEYDGALPRADAELAALSDGRFGGRSAIGGVRNVDVNEFRQN